MAWQVPSPLWASLSPPERCQVCLSFKHLEFFHPYPPKPFPLSSTRQVRMESMVAWKSMQHVVLCSQWPSGVCELKHQPVLIECFLRAYHFHSLLPFHPHAPREEGAPILRTRTLRLSGGDVTCPRTHGCRMVKPGLSSACRTAELEFLTRSSVLLLAAKPGGCVGGCSVPDRCPGLIKVSQGL